jgi:hypothetical protein
MMAGNGAAPLSIRLNRLFDTFHLRHAPEHTNVAVANSVSLIVDRTVRAADIEQIRSGAFDDREPHDPLLLSAIAEYFGVPPEYLAGTGERVEAIDANLRLIAAARDAGVNGLALRGGDLDFSELAAIFAKIAERQSEPAHPATPLD